MDGIRDQMNSGGRTRRYLLFPPDEADGSLLIGLHGATQRGSLMARTTALPQRSAARGMTLVFPDAVDGLWRDGRADDDGIDDVGFIDALIDRLVDQRGLDPARVSLVGASNGGFLAQRLIVELEGRFRAAATVIATMGLRTFQQAWIDAVPSLFLVAGSSDPIIPYDGGPTPNSLLANADAPVIAFADLVSHWKLLGEFHHCTASETTVPGIGAATLELRHENCEAADGHHLCAITVVGGGHQWYGREVSDDTVRRFGATTTAFDLSAEILAFFRRSE